jgi:hypothetical protein
MSDDVLIDDLVRYQILGKLTPGRIIIVGELGNWDIIEPSKTKSALRSFWSLATTFRFPPSQRSIFLKHLETTTNHLISHCDLQMQTHAFHVCLKQQNPTSQDIERFDQIMTKLKTISRALYEGTKGLEILCKTTPYQTDVNFAGEVEIRLLYQIKRFFQRILNTVGLNHAKAVLGEAFPMIQPSGPPLDKAKLDSKADQKQETPILRLDQKQDLKQETAFLRLDQKDQKQEKLDTKTTDTEQVMIKNLRISMDSTNQTQKAVPLPILPKTVMNTVQKKKDGKDTKDDY